MNVVKRAHMIRDIHMNHLIARGEDYADRINTIRKEIETNQKRPHYLITEGGVIGNLQSFQKPSTKTTTFSGASLITSFQR
jgi:hypothetical protein